jgi:hypothetical protein
LWGSGDADADVLNLLYPHADRETNGYCHGSSHSYTYSSVDGDSNCYTYSNVNSDGNCDWDCSAEVYADAQATPHARPAQSHT